ncbi:MAG: succinate dehydrogenase iron-sulfur subunit [Phycisphaerales bacterium]|nr:succinate dehydrogenase iron-sulfur subunit [Phycisphaerales bacterium]
MREQFSVRIQRQDGPEGRPYSQTFQVQRQPDMNVISVLQAIAAQPVTQSGERTTPVAWDCSCLEEVCGACSMLVNGRVRQACSALVEELLRESSTIDLRPMSKFPVVRDLFVNRTRMFEALKKVRAWIPVDTYGNLGEGPTVSPEEQEVMYPISRCMTCGCCLEVCPQVNDASEFAGPQAIAQAVLFNMHPTGKMTAGERLQALMEPGGVADCGNAQNCVKVCPKEVPLTWAIGKAGRDTTVHAVKKWLLK